MQKRAVDERKHIEREYDAGTRKLYVLVFPYEEEIWIDTEALPESTFFCAAFDGISIKKCKVGAEGKEEERIFLPLEWLINEWGGGEKIIESLKKCKKKQMEDMKELKKKSSEE